ncbi:ATP-binding protein [Desulfonatronum parangueonense]
MYARIIQPPEQKSFFLFGPRGTGKSTWVRSVFPGAVYVDLLDSRSYTSLLASPHRLEELIPPGFSDWVVVDEIQRVPELLNTVHRLIENRGLNFVLTGSSARKLRGSGVNLLAGRAVTRAMHPLTAVELGSDFSLDRSLAHGHLPSACTEEDPADYLAGYVHTYLREEVQQEGLVRNLQAFTRFLEAASLSQASVLNISEVARECEVNRKVVEEYFHILEDLLLAWRLPVFTKKAKRRMTAHPKFFLFDAGVFRALRPKGPLDRPEEIDGAAFETLIFQELRAVNDNLRLGFGLYYWRTAEKQEVDFVLYGEKGLIAIEVKRTATIRPKDIRGLRAFLHDYPMAKAYVFYGGRERRYLDEIEVIPLEQALSGLPELLCPVDGGGE